MSRTVLKSPDEIRIMDDANRIIRGILAELRDRIRPGITTLDVDRFAEVARIVKPRTRRTLTPEHKAKLLAASEGHRFKPRIDGSKAPKTALESTFGV